MTWWGDLLGFLFFSAVLVAVVFFASFEAAVVMGFASLMWNNVKREANE